MMEMRLMNRFASSRSVLNSSQHSISKWAKLGDCVQGEQQQQHESANRPVAWSAAPGCRGQQVQAGTCLLSQLAAEDVDKVVGQDLQRQTTPGTRAYCLRGAARRLSQG
jgi:hypothetical protein